MAYIERFRKSLKYFLFFGIIIYLIWISWLILGFYLVKSNYQQTYRVSSLTSSVQVLRDDHAIPLIKAENKLDAIFGLGFVHAQDRYWQMMMMREAAKGRLASHFGIELLNHDRFVKTLDLEGLAKQTFDKQSPTTKSYLESYARGVNAWQEQHKNRLLPITPENFIFQIEFEPWTPEDCLLIQKLMHYDLTNKGYQSLSTMWLMQQLSKTQLETVFPDLKLPKKQPWPKIDYISDNLQTISGGASNAFAINNKASRTGQSMLASDPHLKWTVPSMWLLVSVQWGDQFVTGGTIPGMPAIFIGRNSDLAWGVTMTGSDDQDINLITIDEDNHYLDRGGKKELKTRQIDIKIKNANNFSETVYSTEQGPIIDPALYGFKIDPQNNLHLIMQWTGFNTDDHYFDFQWALMDAHSVNDINDKQRRILAAPNTNLMLADRNDIKMIMTGKLPKRDLNHPTQGRFPGDYTNIETHWQGFLDIKDNPNVLPKGGILANTNNRITLSSFPKNVTFNWIDRYRIKRVDEIISNTYIFDSERLKNMQKDITSYKAKWINTLLLYHLNRDVVSNHYMPLIQSMQVWQGNMNEHAFEPLFYHTWLSLFKKRIYQPYVGKYGRNIEMLNPAFIEQLLKDPNVQKHWCQTDCSDEVNMSFKDAIETMQLQFGDDFEGWQWGRLHSAKHEHPTLGKVPLINLIANIQHPISGDADTIAMAREINKEDGFFIARKGAGLRVVVDFSSPDDTIYMVNSTGQSGHLLSKFYRDQNLLWRRGQYIEFNPNSFNVKYNTTLLVDK